MDDDDESPRREPASRESQRLAWWVAGALAGWLLLALLTGSVLVGLFCDLALGALVAGVAIARRIDGPFPSVLRRLLAARPWHSSAGALRAAARQFPSLFERDQWDGCYAPARVNVHMSPESVDRLYEAMPPESVIERLQQSYRAAIRRYQARVVDGARLCVTLVSDATVPDGITVIRRATGGTGPTAWSEQAQAAWSEQPPAAGSEPTPTVRVEQAPTVRAEPAPTVLQPAGRDRAGNGAGPVAGRTAPKLTLLTEGTLCSTTQSRATAGRDSQCDLVITAARTISRRHAIFSYTGGQWQLENIGRNGIQVNRVAVDTSCPLGDGDVIRWGSLDNSPTSIVQISAGGR